MITGNEPINPMHPDSSGNDSDRIGLTIRQEFARSAMQGILSNHDYTTTLSSKFSGEEFNRAVANDAIHLADTLIAELNKK